MTSDRRKISAGYRRWNELTPAHEAPCCLNARDALGRLPIGFCSPACVRLIGRESRRWFRE